MTDPDERFVPEDEEESPLIEIGRQAYKGKTYAILEDDEDDDSVIIVEVTEADGEECYETVEDQLIAEEVFYLFQAEADDYEIGDAE